MTDKRHNIDAAKLADVLGASPEHVRALDRGLVDGFEQGFELSIGMTYNDLDAQWAYDVGTYVGACLAVRDGDEEMDDTDVAEWVGQHYAKHFPSLDEADKEDMRQRYRMAQGRV
jgi:hypothetical protein